MVRDCIVHMWWTQVVGARGRLVFAKPLIPLPDEGCVKLSLLKYTLECMRAEAKAVKPHPVEVKSPPVERPLSLYRY